MAPLRLSLSGTRRCTDGTVACCFTNKHVPRRIPTRMPGTCPRGVTARGTRMVEKSRCKRYAVLALGGSAILCVGVALVLRFLARVPTFYGAVDGLSAEERTTES